MDSATEGWRIPSVCPMATHGKADSTQDGSHRDLTGQEVKESATEDGKRLRLVIALRLQVVVGCMDSYGGMGGNSTGLPGATRTTNADLCDSRGRLGTFSPKTLCRTRRLPVETTEKTWRAGAGYS